MASFLRKKVSKKISISLITLELIIVFISFFIGVYEGINIKSIDAASPPGGAALQLIPDPAYTVDACAKSTNQAVCYKAYWRFSCSWPVAIYDSDYKYFTANPFDATKPGARLTAPCSNFCFYYATKAGFTDETACRNASINFKSNNLVMSANTTGSNLQYPLATDPDAFRINPTSIKNYCNQILTDLGMPLTHNWNNNCQAAITSFFTSTTPLNAYNGNKLIGYQKYLKDRLNNALWGHVSDAKDLCTKIFSKKIIGQKLGYLTGSDPNSSDWKYSSFGCCPKTSSCYYNGQCYSANQTVSSSNGILTCSVTTTTAYGTSAVWCPSGLSNNTRGQCTGPVNIMADICIKRGWCNK